MPPATASTTDDSIWGEIRNGFSLQERKDPQLVQHILWFKNNQEYLTRALNRSHPYLYHIVKRIKRRKLPMELALLPVIESAFQSYAYSKGHAVGLWQFIPSTGKIYGLKQNWWIDQRRSPLASTDAALYFLTDMAREFDGDWLLALSAYNTGAGNVRKAIRGYHQQQPKHGDNSKRPGFWDLQLPRETRGYVPRLLALARFIEEAERYNFELPEITDRAVTVVVDTEQQIDLALAAELAQLPLEKIHQLNSGLNQWATPPDGPHQLLLPSAHAALFRKNLAKRGSGTRTGWKRHLVESGDSLSMLAQRYNTTVTEIRRQNQLQSMQIRAGERLTIPVPIRPMESYNLDTATDSAKPKKKRVRQWKSTIETTPRARPEFLAKMATHTISYRVQSNDTLSEIAQKFRLSTDDLMRQNQINKGDILRVGDILTIQIDITRAAP